MTKDASGSVSGIAFGVLFTGQAQGAALPRTATFTRSVEAAVAVAVTVPSASLGGKGKAW